MTENEKAATFIGWRPNEVCHGNLIGSEHYPYKCPTQGLHFITAPDMGDPRNYMKALEGLPPEYEWEFNRNPAEGHNCNIWTEDGVLAYGSFPIDTLAALYDSEHPSLAGVTPQPK